MDYDGLVCRIVRYRGRIMIVSLAIQVYGSTMSLSLLGP